MQKSSHPLQQESHGIEPAVWPWWLMDDAGLPPLRGQEARVPGTPGSKLLECSWTKAIYDIKTWHAVQKFEVNALKAPFRHPALSFVGAPGDTYAEASLCYLGDIEISEDATLAELKSQVRLLPAASLSGALVSSSEILTYSFISFSLNYSLF